MRVSKSALLLSMVGLVVSSARGALILPTEATNSSWARPTSLATAMASHSTYQEWDRFTVVGAGNLNLPNSPSVPTGAVVPSAPWNPNGAASVEETTGVAFATSGGNIYSPTSITEFLLKSPNYNLGAAFKTRYLLQFRTLGSALDIVSIQLNGVLLNTLPDYIHSVLTNVSNPGLGGFNTEHKLEFTTLNNTALDTFSFQAAASSMSLDRIALDTFAVPEPASHSMVVVAIVLTAAFVLVVRRV